jgi:sec-independent protein translocase protein TatB
VFNLTGSEIVIILLLALVVLGPEKLPEAVRRFGKTYAELKKLGTGFQQEFKAALDEPVREMRETANLLRSAATDVADQATQTTKAAERTDSVKPVSPGGPTDLRSTDLRAADDPPQSDPATADVPFADSTEVGDDAGSGQDAHDVDGGQDANAAHDTNETHGDGDSLERTQPSPAASDLEQDGEARRT